MFQNDIIKGLGRNVQIFLKCVNSRYSFAKTDSAYTIVHVVIS